MPERRVYSVSELTGRIRDLFARNFTDILVEGEISNCHEAQSGHIYFVLKDKASQIRAVCFKTQVRAMKFRPENGLHVTVRGSISVYEARGDYQIYVESIEPVGLGALQLAFDQLKKRLEAEGLFSPERKKATSDVAALHWSDYIAHRRGRSRRRSHPSPSLSQCAPDVVSGSRSGRRRCTRNRSRTPIFQSPAKRRRADRRPWRRLARRSLGLQRRSCRARHRAVRDSRNLRRRPRNRLHHRRFCRRRSRFHSIRGR